MASRELPQELIRRKRDGQALDAAAIQQLVAGIAEGSVSDAQIGALAMAVFLNGMDRTETVALTEAVRDSGEVLDWSDLDLPGPILDKHSTGGVGDPVSLLLGPWIAACGGFVPMVSGRGLGHTGGTLDKLEAIPGYYLAEAPVTREVIAETPGRIQSMDTRALGLAVVALGGGRRAPDEAIDPAVGLADIASIGETVDAHRPLAVIHAANDSDARTAERQVRLALEIGEAPVSPPPLIQDIIRREVP